MRFEELKPNDAVKGILTDQTITVVSTHREAVNIALNELESYTEIRPGLTNARFAYVSVSRASHEAQISTNDAANLVGRLN